MTVAPSRRVDDDEVVRRDRPQAHRVGRDTTRSSSSTAPRRPRPPTGARTPRPAGRRGSPARPRARTARRRRTAARTPRTSRGRRRMCRLSGLISACSGRRVEEVRRVAHDELVDRRAARDQHRRRPARSGGPRGPRAATSPRSCPDSRPSPHTSSAPMSMPELERVGRHDRAHRAPRAARARSRGAASAGSRRDSPRTASPPPGAPSKSSFR